MQTSYLLILWDYFSVFLQICLITIRENVSQVIYVHMGKSPWTIFGKSLEGTWTNHPSATFKVDQSD